MGPPKDVAPDVQYQKAISLERLRNGAFINATRVGAAALFASIFLFFGRVEREPSWSPGDLWLLLYLAAAALALLVSRRAPQVGAAAGLFIPALDLPVNALVQLSSGGRMQAEGFALAVFASSLFFSRRLLGVTLVGALLLHAALSGALGASTSAWLGGSAMIALAALVGALAARGHARAVRAGVLEAARQRAGLRELEAQALLSDQLTLLGTMAASVAHELNNPLAVLQGGVEVLVAGGESPADRVEVLRDMQLSARHLCTVVKDLKHLSRKHVDELKPVRLGDVVERSLRLVAPQLRERATVVSEEEPAPRVLADDARLTQVLTNLLINASQAIPDGGPRKHRITVRVRQGAAGTAVVEVSDTGLGISPEVRRHLFEPFFTTKPQGVGTGLGLPICRRIVASLGGRIEVDSEPGRGSTFRVLLPGLVTS